MAGVARVSAQLPLPLAAPEPPCQACSGSRQKGGHHAQGCPRRWLTFGESFDELSEAAQRRLHARLAEPGQGFDEFAAGLHRPARRG